jgi:serine protease Do
MRRHSVSDIRGFIHLPGLLTSLLASQFLFLIAAEPASAGSSVFEAISGEVSSIFARSRDAVVKIEGTDQHGKLSGTGFFVDPNGTLYTSYSIGGAAEDLMVVKGDMRYPARRLIGDSRSGIAILKIEAETPSFLPTGTTEGMASAAPVVLVGYPMDLPLSPSFGIVAGMDLGYQGKLFRTTHIRANVPVQRGEAGAPLLNLKGTVVGILISAIDNGSACFALPIDAAEKVRKDFFRFGELKPGWLGLNVEERHSASESTACVTEIVEGGPGHAAGVEIGDFLLQIGKKTIRAPEDILDASYFLTAGDTVNIFVLRGGQTIKLLALPSDPPESNGDPLQLLVPHQSSPTNLGMGETMNLE